MRIRSVLEFIGLVSPPPPPPKRRPTARPAVNAPARPQVIPVHPEVTPTRPVVSPIPERGRSEPGLPPFSHAVATWIRQWGKNGTVPRADAVALAHRRLGLDLAAYLTALRLIDGQLTKYVLPSSRIEDVAATVGLMKHLDRVCYSDLDTWAGAEKIDLENRKNAEWAGRPIPARLHIPDAVQLALIARMNEAAAALRKKGGGAGGRGSPPEPAPDADVREVVAALGEDVAEKRSRMPSEPHPDDEKDAEETATGKPSADANGAPPAPEDGEPESEGGGPATPRA